MTFLQKLAQCRRIHMEGVIDPVPSDFSVPPVVSLATNVVDVQGDATEEVCELNVYLMLSLFHSDYITRHI